MAWLARKRLYLTGPVKSQDLCPDEDQCLSEVCGCCLQELEDIGVDPHTQGQVYCPRTHVQEVAQEPESTQTMHLTQQHLHQKGTI